MSRHVPPGQQIFFFFCGTGHNFKDQRDGTEHIPSLLHPWFRQPLTKIFENADFTGDVTLPSCLARDMDGSTHRWPSYGGHHMERAKLIGVADTRFLWKIDFGTKCSYISYMKKTYDCPITKMSGGFVIFVEQDFLICSGEGQGLTWNRPKVEIASKIPQLPSDTESDDESEETTE